MGKPLPLQSGSALHRSQAKLLKPGFSALVTEESLDGCSGSGWGERRFRLQQVPLWWVLTRVFSPAGTEPLEKQLPLGPALPPTPRHNFHKSQASVLTPHGDRLAEPWPRQGSTRVPGCRQPLQGQVTRKFRGDITANGFSRSIAKARLCRNRTPQPSERLCRENKASLELRHCPTGGVYLTLLLWTLSIPLSAHSTTCAP